jgi:addiction module RelB/DinJ family antitoxin
MTTTATSVRMDSELKKLVNLTLKQLGLNFNTFVVMASKQLVLQNALPFEVKGSDAGVQYLTDVAKSYGLLPDDATPLTHEDFERWRRDLDK